MADDARISTALPRHPKTVKLQRRLGAPGCWSLVCLFLWVAENRPEGDLGGMSSEDIEIAANWPGDTGDFVRTLAEVRFLDGQEAAYQIHDWSEHNPWAASRPRRIEKARAAAGVRWGSKRVASETNATSMQDACEPHETVMPSSPHLSSPLDTTRPSLPLSENSFVRSKEKDYSQTDFDDRDLRKLGEAFKEIDLELQASVGSGTSLTEKQVFEWACDLAGISVQRGLEVQKRGKQWPQTETLGASA